jgi:thioredoxin reductase (NADPH)
MEDRTEVLIIGAGPAGLSAAVNAAARGKHVRLLAAGENVLFKAERVDNYLGLHHLTGKEMMETFLQHAARQGIVPEYGRVANILPFGDLFMINFGGDMIEAKTVILATGVSKAKELPGEAEFLGRGVSYCATCDGMLFRGKRAVVWGASSSAAEEANFLTEIGVKVTYVSGPKYAQGLNPTIPRIVGAVQQIFGEQAVTAVLAGGKKIEAEAVFLLRDTIAPGSLVDGLEMEDGYIRVNRYMETNIPGLYAAGDCTGKPLQVSKAVGEGLIAAQRAAQYLDQKREMSKKEE